MLRTLAELGADTKLRNEGDSTPLTAATAIGTRSPGEDPGTEDQVLEAVEVLLELGADIAVWNSESKQGWTPLAIAHDYRFGNFKPSPPTIAAMERAVFEAGVVPPEAPTATGISDYAQYRSFASFSSRPVGKDGLQFPGIQCLVPSGRRSAMRLDRTTAIPTHRDTLNADCRLKERGRLTTVQGRARSALAR